MSTREHCGVLWTAVRINANRFMRVDERYGGRDHTYYTLHDDMWTWLGNRTGERQSSRIEDSQWWWDRETVDGETTFWFFFRDKDAALEFKLTWG